MSASIAFEGSVASAFASVEERTTRGELSGLQVGMNSVLERHIKTACLEFGVMVLKEVADKYDMDAKEMALAIGLDQIEVKHVTQSRAKSGKSGAKSDKAGPKWSKPSVVLPWTGEVLSNPDTCQGIRKNYGLFSQCVMKSLADGIYCTTCKKQADANATGKPSMGDVSDRLEQGLCDKYTPPGASKPMPVQPYGNFLERMTKTKADKADMFTPEYVIAMGAEFGLTISEEMCEPQEKRKPGRPKTSSDEEGESLTDKAKKAKKTKAKKAKAVAVADDITDEEANAMMDEFEKEDEELAKKTKKAFKAEAHGYDEDDSTEVEEVEASDSDKSTKSTKSTKSEKAKKTKTKKEKTKKPSSKFNFGGFKVHAHKDKTVTVKVDGDDKDITNMVCLAVEDGEYQILDAKTKKPMSVSAFTKCLADNKDDDDSESDDSDDSDFSEEE